MLQSTYRQSLGPVPRGHPDRRQAQVLRGEPGGAILRVVLCQRIADGGRNARLLAVVDKEPRVNGKPALSTATRAVQGAGRRD